MVDISNSSVSIQNIRWDKKPLKNRDTVKLPLVGRLAEITRRGSMLVTHALMGFGKDPAP